MENIFLAYREETKKISDHIDSLINLILNTNIPYHLLSTVTNLKNHFEYLLNNNNVSSTQKITDLNSIHHHVDQIINEINLISKNIPNLDNNLSVNLNSIKSELTSTKNNLLAIKTDSISYNELESQYQKYLTSIKYIDQSKIGTPSISTNNKNLKDVYSKAKELENKLVELEATTKINSENITESIGLFNKVKEKLEEQYSSSTQFIENSNNKIYELLSLASKNAVSGSYLENSYRELRSADRLRGSAVLLMIGIVIFTASSVYDLQKNSIDPWMFLLRIFAGAVFSIPAIYLSRESSKHRNNHLAYIQKSLDLAAFEPFIRDIGEEKGIELRAEMAKNIFFQKSSIDNSESYPIDWNSIFKDVASKIEIRK